MQAERATHACPGRQQGSTSLDASSSCAGQMYTLSPVLTCIFCCPALCPRPPPRLLVLNTQQLTILLPCWDSFATEPLKDRLPEATWGLPAVKAAGLRMSVTWGLVMTLCTIAAVVSCRSCPGPEAGSGRCMQQWLSEHSCIACRMCSTKKACTLCAAQCNPAVTATLSLLPLLLVAVCASLRVAHCSRPPCCRSATSACRCTSYVTTCWCWRCSRWAGPCNGPQRFAHYKMLATPVHQPRSGTWSHRVLMSKCLWRWPCALNNSNSSRMAALVASEAAAAGRMRVCNLAAAQCNTPTQPSSCTLLAILLQHPSFGSSSPSMSHLLRWRLHAHQAQHCTNCPG